jgi:diaminopimelate decarboxylase
MNSSFLKLIPKSLKTPFYFYDLNAVATQTERLKSVLPANTDIHYAMKANANPDILKQLKKCGVGVDTVSGGEIRRALDVGFKPNQILFSGVGKTHEELLLALDSRIKLVNVESPSELEFLGRLARSRKKTVSVGLRLNPNVESGTHPYISTGAHINKFGMPVSMLPDLKRILKKYKKELLLRATDFHIGSQILNLKPFDQAVLKALPIFEHLRSEGYSLKYFDIGGGLGVRYKNEKTIDLAKYGQMVHRRLGSLDVTILCEPGRLLVAESGVLVTTVLYLKPGPRKTFAIVDTGMHHLIRPALYGAYHEIRLLRPQKKKKSTYEIVGPICESSDVLATNRSLPVLEEGDRLAIMTAGAYGYSMANQYNLHRLPDEFVLKGRKVKRTRLST